MDMGERVNEESREPLAGVGDAAAHRMRVLLNTLIVREGRATRVILEDAPSVRDESSASMGSPAYFYRGGSEPYSRRRLIVEYEVFPEPTSYKQTFVPGVCGDCQEKYVLPRWHRIAKGHTPIAKYV